MGNPVRGQVEFEAEERQHTLRYGTNALCALEADLKLPIDKIGEKLEGGVHLDFLRAVFFRGLETVETVEEAGDVIDAIGFGEAGKLIGQAFALAFPAAEAGAVKTNPRKATGGPTGRR